MHLKALGDWTAEGGIREESIKWGTHALDGWYTAVIGNFLDNYDVGSSDFEAKKVLLKEICLSLQDRIIQIGSHNRVCL